MRFQGVFLTFWRARQDHLWNRESVALNCQMGEIALDQKPRLEVEREAFSSLHL